MILTNFFKIFTTFSEPAKENSMNVINCTHICQKTIDLELELMKSQTKMKKVQDTCNAKSAEIKRLKNLLCYYQKRANSMKEIINNLKQQKLISNNAEGVLNVRFDSV